MLKIQSNPLIGVFINKGINEGKGLRFKPGQRLNAEIINQLKYNYGTRKFSQNEMRNLQEN